ncbi:MAG: FAD:protein FMN transferase [Gemmatimonadetes bacterium]|nr:FAD:protein FMN transferase [Gemmatimonadota bacterium]
MRSQSIPRLLVVVTALLSISCASGGERVEGERLAVRTAVREAYQELPGVVLSDRHFALEGEIHATVAAPDTATARAAIEAGFAAADSVEGLVDLHRRGSEVSAINAAAGEEPVVVSPWTETIVAASLDWAERTEGAFDPTVGPLMSAWGFGCEECVAPDSARVRSALARVGWEKVRYDPEAHTVFLTEPGMALDLRAATKGFALDRMGEAIMDAGATAGIVDLGGDHLFFGPGTEGPENLWPVSLADPYDPGREFARLHVPAGALSMTSPYRRVVELTGGSVGHLIDPRTGWPATGLASVTVYARDAIQSDILSTGLFVLGQQRGCETIEGWRDIGAIFVFEPAPGEKSLVCVTPSLRGRVERLDPPFRPLVRDD